MHPPAPTCPHCHRNAPAIGPVPERLLYSRKEAAHLLSLSVRALDYLIEDCRLKTRRMGNRVLVPADELLRFAQIDLGYTLRPVVA